MKVIFIFLCLIIIVAVFFLFKPKTCDDTNLKIWNYQDCEEEYEKRMCPDAVCRPGKTLKMCQCSISKDELKTLDFVGKTYVSSSGNRKITIKEDGEVLVQDNDDNPCFKYYVMKVDVNGKTRYDLGSGTYYEDGKMYIYDGVSGKLQQTTKTLTGYVPRTDCTHPIKL